MVGDGNPSLRSDGRHWQTLDYAAAALLFAFVLATNLATVLNNAYSFGSTLHDSAIFQTIIWRSGWALTPAPVIESISFLNFHFSPILYLASAPSYLVPLDRMSYYGLVYGIIYGALVLVAFHAFLHLTNRGTLAAFLLSLLFYLSGPVNSGQWEPHVEIASALFTLAFFIAWARRRLSAAVAFLLLNVAVREDCGMLLALPLFLLAAHDRWGRHRTEESPAHRHSLRYAVLSAVLSVAAFAVKRIYFNQVDNIALYYYGNDLFSYLSLPLLAQRLRFTLLHAQYTWLPGLVLLLGAARLRDARLAIGWLAFFPFWLFNFLSKLELNAQLGSYKSFPLILTVVWPAVLAFTLPPRERRRMAQLQLVVLLAATLSLENGGLRFAAPSGLDGLLGRWTLHAETERAELYQAFESRLDERKSLGAMRASAGALALYPYSFPRFDVSWVGAAPEEEVDRLDSLLWFKGDRDDATIRKWLKRGNFPYYYQVIGTRLLLATRRPPEALASFAGALSPSPPP
ncbi:MAG: hypothetical protein ACHQRJ_22145 [Alphaproteobacteria bacterium]